MFVVIWISIAKFGIFYV